MALTRKTTRRQPKRTGERSTAAAPLTNIISLRISDEELAALTRICRATSTSVSEIMRMALKQWQADRDRLCRVT